MLLITDKSQTPPSGDKKDYYSLSPYAWPDPNNTKGPWIIKDGQTNTSAQTPDKQKLADIIGSIIKAAHNGDTATGQQILQAWFIDPTTSMNPNMEYAEVIPGKNNNHGSPSGIIGTFQMPDMLDVIPSLNLPSGMMAGLRNWFSKYLNWLTTSDLGQKESQTKNNHATWYAVQTVSYAIFIGNNTKAKQLASTYLPKLMNSQVLSDGRQPEELKRTRSWTYSVFNLEALVKLNLLGKKLGLKNYDNIIQKALDFLVKNKKNWPYKQITPMDDGLDKDIAKYHLHPSAVGFGSRFDTLRLSIA